MSRDTCLRLACHVPRHVSQPARARDTCLRRHLPATSAGASQPARALTSGALARGRARTWGEMRVHLVRGRGDMCVRFVRRGGGGGDRRAHSKARRSSRPRTCRGGARGARVRERVWQRAAPTPRNRRRRAFPWLEPQPCRARARARDRALALAIAIAAREENVALVRRERRPPLAARGAVRPGRRGRRGAPKDARVELGAAAASGCPPQQRLARLEGVGRRVRSQVAGLGGAACGGGA